MIIDADIDNLPRKSQMINRQNNTLKKKTLDILDYFQNPISNRQKQYEAVRAIIVERQSVDSVAARFGYKAGTIYSLVRDAKSGRIDLFPAVHRGPQIKQTPLEVQDKIIRFRREGLSTPDIHRQLLEAEIKVSARTVERILKDAGFRKLKRRTNKELGRTVKNTILSDRAEHLDFSKLEPFSIDTPVAGAFFFIPYIIESGILDIVKGCGLPQSSIIGRVQASLSMMLLKLIGNKRLSHLGAYDQEPGLGVFAGLTSLPKPTYMSTYSCGCSETEILDLQNRVVSSFKRKYPDFYGSDFINLDFHSIPHYGDESEMEKIWCGARGKTMKGANTVFAQDSSNNAIIYTRADIFRSEEALEVKKFVAYWKSINGRVDETLVFDCKFTSYQVLDDLHHDKVKFVTLRKRNSSLVQRILELPQDKWQKVHLSVPKRKYKNVSVYEEKVKLKGCSHFFRQIVVKDHGRAKPTFIVTNNKALSLKEVLEVYAKRWRVENKLGEMVSFFNLNALSSPIMVRIHFDILWTVIADTLYHVFAQDLRRFEKALAPTLFRKFIDMPGKVVYDGKNFAVKIRKRAHTPVLKDVEKLQGPVSIPWLDNKSLEIIWTQ